MYRAIFNKCHRHKFTATCSVFVQLPLAYPRLREKKENSKKARCRSWLEGEIPENDCCVPLSLGAGLKEGISLHADVCSDSVCYLSRFVTRALPLSHSLSLSASLSFSCTLSLSLPIPPLHYLALTLFLLEALGLCILTLAASVNLSRPCSFSCPPSLSLPLSHSHTHTYRHTHTHTQTHTHTHTRASTLHETPPPVCRCGHLTSRKLGE